MIYKIQERGWYKVSDKMNRTLYHQSGNTIPVVIFESMFEAMIEQGLIDWKGERNENR